MATRSGMGTYAVSTPARAVEFAQPTPSETRRPQLAPTATDVVRRAKPEYAREPETDLLTPGLTLVSKQRPLHHPPHEQLLARWARNPGRRVLDPSRSSTVTGCFCWSSNPGVSVHSLRTPPFTPSEARSGLTDAERGSLNGGQLCEVRVRHAAAAGEQVERERHWVHVRIALHALEVGGALTGRLLEALDDGLSLKLVVDQPARRRPDGARTPARARSRPPSRALCRPDREVRGVRRVAEQHTLPSCRLSRAHEQEVGPQRPVAQQQRTEEINDALRSLADGSSTSACRRFPSRPLSLSLQVRSRSAC